MDFVCMFDQLKLGEQRQMCIWIYFEFKFEVHLQMTLQLTSFKWNCQHIVTMNITLQCWSCALALHYIYPLFDCLLDRRATGIGGHPLHWRYCYRTSSARKATPPFDHVDKNPFPSQSRLCMNRMITLSILLHSWTHILWMACHLVTVVSKPQS